MAQAMRRARMLFCLLMVVTSLPGMAATPIATAVTPASFPLPLADGPPHPRSSYTRRGT
jgi:hypothetical protein